MAAGAYVAIALGCHVYTTGAAVPAATSGGAWNNASGVAPGCLPAGLGLDGALCSGPSSCAAAYECVGGSPGAFGTCRHYCCHGNDACNAEQFCDIQPVAVEQSINVPVCMPIDHCILLAQPSSCPLKETCAVVREDGRTSCVATGYAKAGQSCDTEHCAAGLVCLGSAGERTCFALCSTRTPTQCTSTQKCQGGLPLFPDPDVGICQ
jgi:hypothetical protein